MENSGWKSSASEIFYPLSAILVFLAGLALALWSLALDQRPMHNDEAVNGVKFGQLWDHGGYQYDPNEHHGPSLPYATLALGRLTGRRRTSISSPRAGSGSSRFSLVSA